MGEDGRVAGDGGRDGRGDAALGWSPSAEMTPFEVLMWRAEADPALRSTVLVLELLDAVPDVDRYLGALEWATRMVPRLRERITVPLLGAGTPYWSVDPDFDLHYHVRRTRLPEPGGPAELFALAEQVAMTPLDPLRPQWEATLVEGLPDGRAAHLFKTTHVLSDGMGLAQLLSGLHSRRRAHDPGKPQPLPARPPDPGSTLPAGLGGLRRQVLGDARLLVDAARGALGSLSALRDPPGALRHAVAYAASARRVIAPPSAAPLATLSTRSTSWRLRALDVDFAALRAAGKAAGGSVNDAYLAGLLGGFRRYAAARGEELAADRTMPVTVPVSTRRDADPAGGNRFAPGRMNAPVGLVDPAERVRAVSAVMRGVRDEPALEVLDVVTPLISRIPGTLLAALGGGGATGGNDLQASNIPGLREEVFLAGARVDRVYPYAPLPGCAAMIAMFTHGEQCCLAMNLDAAAIADLEGFQECLVEGFVEVLALAGDDPPRPRRTSLP
jgi:diacylglycerol O-acyltransferase / wax synthase